jgi:putative hydrolase of the HAD superfamily
MGIAHDDALIAQLIEVYRHHRPDLTLPADSRQVLETLKPNYRLASLTDGFMPAQRLKVIALGLEPWFETIVYTEELGRAFWKPSPVGFQTLLQRLGVTADCAVYVGDNETKDFIAPNALGMLTIQVQRPARLHPDTGAATNAAARLKAEEIAALPDLLARY